MSTVIHPTLLQIKTRVWLTELSRKLARPATRDDNPVADLDDFPPQASTGSGC